MAEETQTPPEGATPTPAETKPQAEPLAPGQGRFKVVMTCHFGGSVHQPAKPGDQPVILIADRKHPAIIALARFKQVVEVDENGKPVVIAKRKQAK